MNYYIPLYESEPIILCGVSKEMDIIQWLDVPNKVKDLLQKDGGIIPQSVAITENPKELVSTEIFLLSFISGKPYYVYQWANENVVCRFAVNHCIMSEKSHRMIKDECLEAFLKLALPRSHVTEIQKILSYYYEIRFRTSSVQVRIMTLVSLLECIVSIHKYEKEVVVTDQWINDTLKTFVDEMIRNDYCNDVDEGKRSDKYNLLRNNLNHINDNSTKKKIQHLCTECGLNVDKKTIDDIFKARNNWTHGGTSVDVDQMVTIYPKLKMIVEMLIMYEITGCCKNYQQFMFPFTDNNGIVQWERFFKGES